MKLKRTSAKLLTELVSLFGIIHPPKYGLRIFNYHSIGGIAFNDNRRLFSISRAEFINHIYYLTHINKCKFVSLSPINIPLNKLHLALTFDDGYLDNLKVAAPLLIENKIPFTVFVTSEFIRKRTKGFLQPDDLKELANLPGVTIGSHGKTHKSLTSCSSDELKEELLDSKLYLEGLIGRVVDSIAYPFGAIDLRVCDIAKNNGYNLGFCTKVNINKNSNNLMMLNRTNIENDNSLRMIEQKMNGYWDWYRFLSNN